VSNESYLADICKQLENIPRGIATTVASEIFEQAVQQTRVDSGQAAANWKFEPYKGSFFLDDQEILWGFAGHDPVYPAGYKWSMYDNAEAVYRYQFEQLTDAIAMMPDDIDGIVVYNPITVGFAGFQPGDDLFYPDNAFARLDMDGIVSTTLQRIYAEYNQTFGAKNA
jgi:hypothetical protein